MKWVVFFLLSRAFACVELAIIAIASLSSSMCVRAPLEYDRVLPMLFGWALRSLSARLYMCAGVSYEKVYIKIVKQENEHQQERAPTLASACCCSDTRHCPKWVKHSNSLRKIIVVESLVHSKYNTESERRDGKEESEKKICIALYTWDLRYTFILERASTPTHLACALASSCQQYHTNLSSRHGKRRFWT